MISRTDFQVKRRWKPPEKVNRRLARMSWLGLLIAMICIAIRFGSENTHLAQDFWHRNQNNINIHSIFPKSRASEGDALTDCCIQFHNDYSGFISEHSKKSFLIQDLSISPSDFRKRSFSIQDLNSASTLIGFAPLSVLKLPVAFDTSAMLKPLKGQILTALSLDTMAFDLANREFISGNFGNGDSFEFWSTKLFSHPMQPKKVQAAPVESTLLSIQLQIQAFLVNS